MNTKLSKAVAQKVLDVVDQGLCEGVGEPTPGKMCVEAAVCYALGEPHGDNPSCVGGAVRRFKINLNDSAWSSDTARAAGMRRVAIAQLGSKEIDQVKFAGIVALENVRKILPIALRACAAVIPAHKEALEAAALVCELVKDLSAAYSAASAADSAAYSAASAAYSAARSAAYRAASAADSAVSAAYSAASAAYSAAYSAADSAAYSAASAADSAASAADSAARSAASAAYSAARSAVSAAYSAASAAYSAAYSAADSAADSAAYSAASAADSAASARDGVLTKAAEIAVVALKTLKCEGTKWLGLTEHK